VEGDVGDPEASAKAMKSCSVAYYLIHSMIASGDAYREEDQRLARVFSGSAAACGVGQIIYLGGLGETGSGLSEHLASRREVEAALASCGVPVTVLRAAMIIGSGSASFEILRYLVERLPAMITPRWVSTECQPISINDALRYLETCLELPETLGRTLDIGGPDILTYRAIMGIVAKELGLSRKLIVPVPVLTPSLSSLWIHIVTPVSHRIARPLADGLRNRVVCRNDEAVQLMPGPRDSVQAAVAAALKETRGNEVESRWDDAGPVPGDPDWAGGTVYTDRRKTLVNAPPAVVFRVASRIGGRNGWFKGQRLWRFRGMVDRLIGGPGLGRGRRRPDRAVYGDVVDSWRVSRVEEEKLLELRSEMRLPGIATLEFSLKPREGGTILTQTARFRPRGLLGILYWYAVTPFHRFVFKGMLHGIRDRSQAERLELSSRPLLQRTQESSSGKES
jgi:uncharacterized protein YbjT (DUF2867 family)